MTRTLDRAWLDARIAAMIDEGEPVDPAENLTLYGLDSISVMQLIAELEGRGLRLTFEDVLRQPTRDAWWDLIAARQAA